MYTQEPLRILIADDSDRVRALVRDQLSPLPFAKIVGEAASTNEALALVESSVPNVVILDIAMPGSGIRALRTLKQQQPAPRVVMLTNHAGPYYRKICLDGGADVFLDKTAEFEQIPEVLQRLAAEEDADTEPGHDASNGELDLFRDAIDRMPSISSGKHDSATNTRTRQL